MIQYSVRRTRISYGPELAIYGGFFLLLLAFLSLLESSTYAFILQTITVLSAATYLVRAWRARVAEIRFANGLLSIHNTDHHLEDLESFYRIRTSGLRRYAFAGEETMYTFRLRFIGGSAALPVPERMLDDVRAILTEYGEEKPPTTEPLRLGWMYTMGLLAALVVLALFPMDPTNQFLGALSVGTALGVWIALKRRW